jgi:predicted nucleic acid-binding protein
MKIVLLDGNIYNSLAGDATTCEHITKLIEEGRLKVIATRTVSEELSGHPFYGIPKFFPVEYTSNTVGAVGIMCAGDSLGNGAVFYAHRGQSGKNSDALIADAASCKADWLVTEDRRLGKRLNEIPNRCKSLLYAEFLSELRLLIGPR